MADVTGRRGYLPGILHALAEHGVRVNPTIVSDMVCYAVDKDFGTNIGILGGILSFELGCIAGILSAILHQMKKGKK